MRRAILTLIVAIPVGCLGESAFHQEVGRNQPVEDASPASVQRRLLEIAGKYRALGSPDLNMRQAGFVCDFNPTNFVTGIKPADSKDDAYTRDVDLPVNKTPPAGIRARLSQSVDTDTHGKKMYLIYARHKYGHDYAGFHGNPVPVGQIVVKEAWLPEEVTGDGQPRKRIARPAGAGGSHEDIYPYATRNGHEFHAKEVYGLFIMYKLDPETPDTDAGWIYGTATAAGSRILSAGKLDSCMKCHATAPHDRLFGYPE
ncbi:MAG: hypothetical protein AB7K24_11135 [Gemmataceae bacterium]